MRNEEEQRKAVRQGFGPLRLMPHASRLTALVLALLLAACGYHFPGGGGFPAGIKKVYLQADPEDSPLSRALEDALTRDTSVDLAHSAKGADAILKVKGGNVSSSTAAIGSSGVATEYEVAVRASYRLVRPLAGGEGVQGGAAPGEGGSAKGQGKEKVIRERKGLEVTSTFPYSPSTNPAAEEANKRKAGQQAAQDLAQRIIESIKSGF